MSWTQLLLLCAAISPSAAKQPNIFFIFADDWGYNDVGYHNPEIKTPFIDQLGYTGIILEQSYVQPYCTPSRAALLTGMYPYHIGRQTLVLYGDSPTGLTLERKLLPEALKDLGYSTHMIGKWHLGHCNEAYLPNQRGFDSYLGYWVGLQYYYNKTYYGYDFHEGNDLVTDPLARETYSTFLYRDRANSIIRSHAATSDAPLFFYLAYQNPHYPLEVPPEYEALYPDEEDPDRRMYSGIVTSLDDAVKSLVETLVETGLYDESVIVVVGDNGGKTGPGGGASNEPLRGAKGSIYEGGTRTPALIHSPLLAQSGFSSDSLIHVSDWLPTLLTAAEASPEFLQDHFPDLDGINQYDHLFNGGPAPRNEFVYNIEERSPTSVYGGIRSDQWKLIATKNLNNESRSYYDLYDLMQDPEERHDVSEDNLGVFEMMKDRFEALRSSIVPDDDQPGVGFDIALDAEGNHITNWCTLDGEVIP